MSGQDLRGRTILITGANTGIGRATALSLARRGASLFLLCRSRERTEPVMAELRAAGSEAVTFLPLHLEDLASVRECAGQFLAMGTPLDVLINNAGLAGKPGLTRDGFELAFGVNHLGPFLLTEMLRPRLHETAEGRSAPGRIVIVASSAHYKAKGIDWNALEKATSQAHSFAAYGVSKLCNVLYARELARRMTNTTVHSYALHPGVIASDIWRQVPWPIRPVMKAFMKSNEEGAQTTLYCATAEAPRDESGLYYENCRVIEPSRAAQDEALARELFERSQAWTGLA